MAFCLHRQQDGWDVGLTGLGIGSNMREERGGWWHPTVRDGRTMGKARGATGQSEDREGVGCSRWGETGRQGLLLPASALFPPKQFLNETRREQMLNFLTNKLRF